MNERLKNFLFIIAVIVGFTIVSFFRGETSIILDFNDDSFTVSAPENFTYSVNYSNINQIELLNEFNAGKMLSGGETKNNQWGTWENDIWGKYTLCVSQKIENALLITHSDDQFLVLNYENEETTENLLNLFLEIKADHTRQ